MKIVTVCMVKNEENYIESFVRHSLTFSDTVIVFNHNSSDGTLNILNELSRELTDKVIIYETSFQLDLSHDQSKVTDLMIEYSFNSLNADFVLPLDCDEFPYVENQINGVRGLLESLSQNHCYEVEWMPFLACEKNESDFVPFRFNEKSKYSISAYKKMIITRQMYFDYSLRIARGNHTLVDLVNQKTFDDNKLLSPSLYYAHYRYRNVDNYIDKVVNGWVSSYIRDDYSTSESTHKKKGFDVLLSNKEIDRTYVDLEILNETGLNINLQNFSNFIETFDPSKNFENNVLKYNHLKKNKSSYVLLMETVEGLSNMCRNKNRIISELNDSILYKNSEIERLLICEKELNSIKESRAFEIFRKICNIKDKVTGKI